MAGVMWFMVAMWWHSWSVSGVIWRGLFMPRVVAIPSFTESQLQRMSSLSDTVLQFSSFSSFAVSANIALPPRANSRLVDFYTDAVPAILVVANDSVVALIIAWNLLTKQNNNMLTMSSAFRHIGR